MFTPFLWNVRSQHNKHKQRMRGGGSSRVTVLAYFLLTWCVRVCVPIFDVNQIRVNKVEF